MSQPRVLVLTDKYPPHIIGGYEVACASVAGQFQRMGVPVRVVTSTFGVGRETVNGDVWRVLHRPHDSSRLLELGWQERRDHRTLRRVIADWRPDVVYAWSMAQLFATIHGLLARLALPVVINIQDLWLPGQFERHDELRRAWLDSKGGIVTRVARRCRAAIAARLVPAVRTQVSIRDVHLRSAVFGSAFRQAQLTAAGFDTRGSKVIHNGVDVRRYAPGQTHPASGLRLLTTGRLVHEKGVHTAIEAIDVLVGRGARDVTLTIGGFASHPWEYAEALKKSVSEKRLDKFVRFRLNVDDAKMPALYRDHDVFLFPSIGPEGFPMGVLEAMASGLCVIGTTTGGTAEVLEHEINGLAFTPGDGTMLADTIERVRRDRQLAADLGRRGRRLMCSRFAIEAIAAEHLDHLSSVVRGDRAADAGSDHRQ
jgi:glycogen synthase